MAQWFLTLAAYQNHLGSFLPAPRDPDLGLTDSLVLVFEKFQSDLMNSPG